MSSRASLTLQKLAGASRASAPELPEALEGNIATQTRKRGGEDQSERSYMARQNREIGNAIIRENTYAFSAILTVLFSIDEAFLVSTPIPSESK